MPNLLFPLIANSSWKEVKIRKNNHGCILTPAAFEPDIVKVSVFDFTSTLP